MTQHGLEYNIGARMLQGAHAANLSQLAQQRKQQQQPTANGVHLPNGSALHPQQPQQSQSQSGSQPSSQATASSSQPSVTAILQQLAPLLHSRQQQQQQQQQKPLASGAAQTANGLDQPGIASVPSWPQGSAQPASHPAELSRKASFQPSRPAVGGAPLTQLSFPAPGGPAAAPSAAAQISAAQAAAQGTASAVWLGSPPATWPQLCTDSPAAASQHVPAAPQRPTAPQLPGVSGKNSVRKVVEAIWSGNTAAAAAPSQPSSAGNSAGHQAAPGSSSSGGFVVPVFDSSTLARLTALMKESSSAGGTQPTPGKEGPDNRTGHNGHL